MWDSLVPMVVSGLHEQPKINECLESSFNVTVDYTFKAIYKIWSSSFQET